MAVHALVLLSGADDWAPSDGLALSVGAQPSHLRALLATLARAGLVSTRGGRTGGYQLARPADTIPLSEVYLAIETGGLLAPSPCEPNSRCYLGGGMRRAFDDLALRACEGAVQALGAQTVADVARSAHRHNGRPAPPPGFHLP